MNTKETEKVLQAIKDRLERVKSMGQTYTSNIWRPSAGRTAIRIVPYKDSEIPFVELYFHYNIGATRAILCPQKSIGIMETYDCPICEFSKSLYKDGEATEENRKLYSIVKPKLRVFVPIVVRGEEFDDSGNPKVKLWGFGTTIYTTMLELVNDPDYGIIWDVNEGIDINVSHEPPTGKEDRYGRTSITPRPKRTPLAPTKEQIESIVDSVPNILEIYNTMSRDEIAKRLDEWLSGSEVENNNENEHENEVPEVDTINDEEVKEENDEINNLLKNITNSS